MSDSRRAQHLRSVRIYELDKALKLFPTTGRVLELGAGAGWQARYLTERGYDVFAIDVLQNRYVQGAEFPIILYDGIRIPFRDKSFDVVFSSNVLEHIRFPDLVDSELKRVVREAGVVIHVVPSASWRFWTLVTHHFYVIRLAVELGMSVVIGQTKERSLVGAHRALSCRKKLKLLFWPDRHGEHGNVLSELFLFSKNHWLKQFEAKNWRVEVLAPAGLFYTGNQILHRHLPAYLRYVVSTIMGSSSWIFKLRRNM